MCDAAIADAAIGYAATVQMSRALRHLFATDLVACEVGRPSQLFYRFGEAMSEDSVQNLR
jgi:hypothetical protein